MIKGLTNVFNIKYYFNIYLGIIIIMMKLKILYKFNNNNNNINNSFLILFMKWFLNVHFKKINYHMNY